ncbi:MAG: winged helix-turn-helix domain-containing protein [Thermoguttaceae bacterium]|nr:winged helix-turn-helix domain-containing protein [Thermoguttaceae bacterium]
MSETIYQSGEPSLPAQDQVPAMGVMAGRIWYILHHHGKLSVSAIVRKVNAPRDYVMEGLGWLARENKIQIVEESRIRMVSLKE